MAYAIPENFSRICYSHYSSSSTSSLLTALRKNHPQFVRDFVFNFIVLGLFFTRWSNMIQAFVPWPNFVVIH